MISVIIPTYNYSHFIRDAIKSVQAQTYTKWECIVVDDGSTDNTRQVVEELCAADNRIKYIYQVNAGPTVARNLGLKKSKGEYIQFLDADDLIQPKKFEWQLSVFAEHPEYEIVYGGVKYFNSQYPEKLYNTIQLTGEKSWMPNVSGKGDQILLPLLKENIMVISSPLVRKSVLAVFGNLDEGFYYNEDWELWLRLAINNIHFEYSDHEQTNALVRVHPSYSTDNLKMFIFGLKVCLKISQTLTDYKYQRILIPKINYHKKIIDQKLVELAATDRQKAVQMAEFLYRETGVANYKRYPHWYAHYSHTRLVWLTTIRSYFNKINSIIKYGS